MKYKVYYYLDGNTKHKTFECRSFTTDAENNLVLGEENNPIAKFERRSWIFIEKCED